MIPLVSNRFILKDSDFYEPIITETDMLFLEEMAILSIGN